MNGVNINIGGGAYSSTMLGGSIALLVASGFVETVEMSDKLFLTGIIIFTLSWIIYFLRLSYRAWLYSKEKPVM